MSSYREAMGEARRAWEEAVAAARRSAEAAMALLAAPERLARQEQALQEVEQALKGLRERVEGLEGAIREAAEALAAREEGERALWGEVERAQERIAALQEEVRALGQLLEGASGRLEELETAFRGHLEMEREFLRQLVEDGGGLMGVAMAARGQAASPGLEEGEGPGGEGDAEEEAVGRQPAAEGEELPPVAAASSWPTPLEETAGGHQEMTEGEPALAGAVAARSLDPEADARELKQRLERRRRMLRGGGRRLWRFLLRG